MRRHGIWTAILLGGLIAGTIDIGAAALITGRSPVFILHVIAGGLLGKTAITSGGMGASVLGLVLQWVMSIVIAAVYVLGKQFVPLLTRSWIVSGLAYGAVVFFAMNYVVVPLSAYHRMPQFSWPWFAENMTAMLVFGVIVAYCANRARA